jgi:hypothetical protein
VTFIGAVAVFIEVKVGDGCTVAVFIEVKVGDGCTVALFG